MNELWKSVGKSFDRAIQAVGVLPALLALAVLGAAMFIYAASPAWLAIALFGALGATEFFYRQRKADLIERRGVPQEDHLLRAIWNAHPTWKPKVLKEFQCGGLLIRATGFEELEVPLSIAGPLCPRCGGRLAERREMRFPFRHWIEHRCACGFARFSKQTLGEIHQEARDFAGCPE